MANFVSFSDAQTLFADIGTKLRTLSGAYVIRGNSTFANLPSVLTKAMSGYVYNITDDFTTDARFVEGAGKKYTAGTNVVIIDNGTSGNTDMKFDVIGSFVDVDEINARIDAVSDSITTNEFDVTETYDIGDVVKYNDSLYKFKAAHAAGEWNPAEADRVTVLEMIESAEPDSFTSEQITALLALLD